MTARRRVLTLISGLILTFTAFSGVARPNGGVIILHAVYQFCSGSCDSGTVILISTDAELAAARERFSGYAYIEAIEIEDGANNIAFATRPQYVAADSITARDIRTGRTVLIVNETYARSRHWM